MVNDEHIATAEVGAGEAPVASSTASMQAGRELDLLIAEKVMGFDRWNARVDPMNRNGEPQYYMGYPHGHDFAPEYSTDLTAAMQVAMKLMQRPDDGFWLYAELTEPDLWLAGFENMEVERVSDTGETLPLAICRAALKACESASRVRARVSAPHDGVKS